MIEMSKYGLIKATSMIRRSDTITDLNILNRWLYEQGGQPISSYGPSVRALENSVALGLERIGDVNLPKMVRSESFYRSCLPEITEKERSRWMKTNRPENPDSSNASKSTGLK